MEKGWTMPYFTFTSPVVHTLFLENASQDHVYSAFTKDALVEKGGKRAKQTYGTVRSPGRSPMQKMVSLRCFNGVS